MRLTRPGKKPVDWIILIGIATPILACLGLVCAASVTTIGNYIGIQSQALIPIQATQTAETRLTAAAPTRAPRQLSTSTPSLSTTPDSTQPMTPTPVASATSAPTEDVGWKEYIEASTYQPCAFDLRVMPERPDPSVKMSADFVEEYLKGDGSGWPRVQDSYGNEQAVDVGLKLTSKLTEDWIEVNRTTEVAIEVEKQIPNSVDVLVITGCGGLGDIRGFPKTDLVATFAQYTQDVSFSEADFFKLEPGEFETFNFPFTCRDIGLYKIRLVVPLAVGTETERASVTTSIMCPEAYTLWYAGADGYIETSQRIVWNGENYAKEP